MDENNVLKVYCDKQKIMIADLVAKVLMLETKLEVLEAQRKSQIEEMDFDDEEEDEEDERPPLPKSRTKRRAKKTKKVNNVEDINKQIDRTATFSRRMGNSQEG